MMYRRNVAQHLRTGTTAAIAKLTQQGADGFKALLDAFVKMGLFAQAERENRQRTRAAKRYHKHASYPYCGKRHRERLARQIAAGQKKAENGVVFS